MGVAKDDQIRLKSSLSSSLPWLGGGLVGGLVLALLDPVDRSVTSVPAYLILALFGALALWAVWRWLGAPRALVAAVIAAVVLRLFLGLALSRGLPSLGYPDSKSHQAGYFYLDAFRRDLASWNLARSSTPLTAAFTERVETDQYGGLLFISGLVYRTLSPTIHRPMLVGSLGAITGGLAVLFTWGFTTTAFGSRSASLAAWGMALYPEAVLLGASHMREPFLIAFFAAALYGYALVRAGRLRDGLVAVAIFLALSALISPPYTLIFAFVLIVAWIWEGYAKRIGGFRLVVLLSVVGLLTLALTAGAWSQIGQAPQGSLMDLLDWWVTTGARYELAKLEQSSGWVQKLFDQTPEWAHLPMATGNGLVQPFLPATLMDTTGAALSSVIGIWRSLGWFVLLPFLLYAPFAAFRAKGWRSLQFYLSVVVWVTALAASFRLAGDQWDNPRARAVFLAAQVSIAGWTWVHARGSASPWLKRIAILVGAGTLSFLSWYAGRYQGFPRLSLYATSAGYLAFAILFLVGALLMDRKRRGDLTAGQP
ncbi:MAG: hypothetical protein O7G88_15440 [bacterium]|nr:hypothetical protein [bacterium]